MFVVAVIVGGCTYYVSGSNFIINFLGADRMTFEQAQTVVKYLGYGSILRAE